MRKSFGVYALWVVFLAVIGFLVFTAATTAGFNWWGFIPPFIAFTMLFVRVYGEYAPFLRVPTYLNVAGGMGKVIDLPQQLPGNRLRIKIAVPNKLVPERFKEAQGDWKNFEASMAGSTIMFVEDFAHSFQWISQNARDAPEEVLFHNGSLSGVHVKTMHDYLSQELDEKNAVLTKLSTIYDRNRGIVEAGARQDIHSFKAVSQEIAGALREMSATVNKYDARRGED